MDRDPWRINRKKKGCASGVAFLGILIGVLTMFADARAGSVILIVCVVMACGVSAL